MDEDLVMLKEYVECLKLHEKTNLSEADFNELLQTLGEADELTLAGYVNQFKSPKELEDFIVNTLYG